MTDDFDSGAVTEPGALRPNDFRNATGWWMGGLNQDAGY